MNLAFKRFVTKNISETAAGHLEELSKIQEENELELENEREEKKASKCKKCCLVFCCWFSNKKNSIAYKNTTIYQQMIASQTDVREKKIFKRFLTKTQKQESASKPTFATKDETNDDPSCDYYSLQELMDMKSLKLKSMYFEIIKNQDQKTPTYYNVHKKKYMKNGMEKTMIQIVDVSQ